MVLNAQIATNIPKSEQSTYTYTYIVNTSLTSVHLIYVLLTTVAYFRKSPRNINFRLSSVKCVYLVGIFKRM